MSGKYNSKNAVQYVGIALFVVALATFIGSLTLSRYQLDAAALQTEIGDAYQYAFVAKATASM